MSVNVNKYSWKVTYLYSKTLRSVHLAYWRIVMPSFATFHSSNLIKHLFCVNNRSSPVTMMNGGSLLRFQTSVSNRDIMGDGGGGHWLVWMEWRPPGWSVCLPLLIFPCIIQSRSSLLAPAHPGGPGKRAVKRLWYGGGGVSNRDAMIRINGKW